MIATEMSWSGAKVMSIQDTRKVPSPPGDDFYMYYQIPAVPGRGSYDATVYYLE